MPTQFDLPQLDQKDYAKLFEELRNAIPQYSSTWTDFNDSDPGITLLQLFAWLGDVSLYRIDRMPRALYLNFARMVLGAGYDAAETLAAGLQSDVVTDSAGKTAYFGDNEPIVMDPDRLALAEVVVRAQKDETVTISELRAACLSYIAASYTAVTAADFEAIALQMTSRFDAEDAARFKVMRAVVQVSDALVRLVLVSGQRPKLKVKIKTPEKDGKKSALPPLALCQLTATATASSVTLPFTSMEGIVEAALQYFAPRLLVGTALKVVQVARAPLMITGLVAVLPHVTPQIVLQEVFEALLAWLDPVTGGSSGTGWPVGARVREHDLSQALAKLEGLDHSQPLALRVRQYKAVELGRSILCYGAPVGADPRCALPQITNIELEAVHQTWPIEVGVHADIGVTTRLPFPEDA